MVIKMRTNKSNKYKLRPQDIKKNSASEVGHVITKIKTEELKMTVIWVSIIFVLLCSFLYVAFSSIQKRELNDTVRNGPLLVHYGKNDMGIADIVTIVDEAGISDNSGLKRKPYTFSITNKSINDVRYQIILEDDSEMIEIDECDEFLLSKDKVRFSLDNGEVKSLYSVYNDKNYVLTEGVLSKKSSKKYKLRVWIDENEVDINKHYHGKIVVKVLK